MTFRKMTNMTVAMIVAAVVSSAEMNVQIANGKDHQREYSTMGARKMFTKFMHDACQEEAEHQVAGDLDQVQDVVDLGW
jgi:hypothetical protein